MTAKYHFVLAAGIIGIIASLLMGWGEFLLHFNSLELQGLKLPNFLITLAILSSPVTLAGYWHIYQMLNPKKNTMAFTLCALGGYGLILGSICVVCRLLSTFSTQELGGMPSPSLFMDQYHYFLETLLHITRITLLVFSLGLMILISFRPTSYPWWFIFFTPIPLLMIFFCVVFTAPTIEIFMTPIALSAAHFIFFITSTFVCFNRNHGLYGEKV